MSPIVVVFLTVVLDLVGFGIVIPLLPFYAEAFHATPLQVTLLMACFSAAQFLVAPVMGQLSDRVGRRPVLVASIGLTAVMLAAFASAKALWMLFLFRTLHGAMTANISTAQACMADLTTPENRAKGMGLIGAAFGIGFTIGPFVGGELYAFAQDSPGWQSTGLLPFVLPLGFAAFLSFVDFLLAWRWLPETRHPGSARSERSISPATLVRAFAHPGAGLCIALAFAQVFAFAMMESTFTLFAEREHAMTPRDVGRMFGLVGVVGIVVQGGLIGRVVKRWGERPLVPLGLATMAVALVALPFAPRGVWMQLDFAVLAVGQGLTTPSVNALISRATGPDEQGAVLGSSQSMGALARATGPALGGVLFERLSHAAPFWSSAVLLALAAVFAVPATARAVAYGRRR
ncbi:MAG: MFS transporter [Myxococcota bacterium]